MSGLILQNLESRGLLVDTSGAGELGPLLGSSQTVYAGFDPSADSLHIGSLVPLMVLRRFQLEGHKPLLLLGGATGLIGDPSFKAQERQLQMEDTVSMRTEKLTQQVSQWLDFSVGDYSAKIVNNLSWTKEISALSFLRDIGKYFSVNNMIRKESVKQRIERDDAGISFAEFSYIILQAYDFSQLYHLYGCRLQIGGSDQWGNITAGIDLTRRLYQGAVYGLTLPLVTKSDGSKFGKTESGTIWLDANKTSPYMFYQFWLNVADNDVYRFLKFFTFLSVEEINEIERIDSLGESRPQAQRILAQKVTAWVHGEAALIQVEKITSCLFSNSLMELKQDDLAQLEMDGMPFTEIKSESLSLAEALVETALAKTPLGEVTIGQARKLIKQNAISVNGVKVSDVNYEIASKDWLPGCYVILKRGKKEFSLVRMA